MVVLLTRLVLPQQLLHQLLHQGKQQLTLMEKVIKIPVLDIHVLMVLEAVVLVVLGSNRPLGALLVLAVLVKHFQDSLHLFLLLAFLHLSDPVGLLW